LDSVRLGKGYAYCFQICSTGNRQAKKPLRLCAIMDEDGRHCREAIFGQEIDPEAREILLREEQAPLALDLLAQQVEPAGAEPTPHAFTLRPMPLSSDQLAAYAELNTRYDPILSSSGLSRFRKAGACRIPPREDPITRTLTYDIDGNLSLTMSSKSLIDQIGVSAHKLLDVFILELTQRNDYRGAGEPHTVVSLPLRELLKKFGKPETKSNLDELRKSVKIDLETLYNCSLGWKEEWNGKTTSFENVRLCSHIGIKNGHVLFDFSNSLARYLNQSYLTQYPRKLLQIDGRNAIAYRLGNKLAEHWSIRNNRKKGTHNIISVEKLLEVVPDIPSRETVEQKDRHFYRAIQLPLVKGLDALVKDGVLKAWNFCDARKKKRMVETGSLSHFFRSYVHFELY
ncbi:MAG: hypothetical protein LBF21_02505, partial [Puniceicoccales bacterium]|nr:hypothetical protein [Puniceicoccales bacterium]